MAETSSLNCLSCRIPYQRLHIHWMPRPHSVKRRFSSLISASSHPLAHQNRTIAIASDFRVDGAKSPEIPQKEGVLGSEIAAQNRTSLATFSIAPLNRNAALLSLFSEIAAISGVRDGHRNRRSQKSLRFRCAKSHPLPPTPLGNASLFTKFLFTIFVPLDPPPPNQLSDGFSLEFLLKGPQQNCEHTAKIANKPSKNCEQTEL